MQPGSPVAFLGAFFIGLAALVGVFASLLSKLSALTVP